LSEAADEAEQRRQWGWVGELLAESLRTQAAILATLNRGIPVLLVRKQKQVSIPDVPRPPWMKHQAEQEVPVVSLRQLASIFN
jgi:hypothetical protein